MSTMAAFPTDKQERRSSSDRSVNDERRFALFAQALRCRLGIVKLVEVPDQVNLIGRIIFVVIHTYDVEALLRSKTFQCIKALF